MKSENSLADILTKNVKEEIFEKHMKTMDECKVKYETKEEKLKEAKMSSKKMDSHIQTGRMLR